MNFAISFGLLLLGLFVLPVLVSGCLPDGRNGLPWYEARCDPTGLAPDPETTSEAVVQVYAARAVSWLGVFAVHTWGGARGFSSNAAVFAVPGLSLSVLGARPPSNLQLSCS